MTPRLLNDQTSGVLDNLVLPMKIIHFEEIVNIYEHKKSIFLVERNVAISVSREITFFALMGKL